MEGQDQFRELQNKLAKLSRDVSVAVSTLNFQAHSQVAAGLAFHAGYLRSAKWMLLSDGFQI